MWHLCLTASSLELVHVHSGVPLEVGSFAHQLHHAFAVAGVQVAGLLLWILGQQLPRLQSTSSWAWPAQMHFLVSIWLMVGMIPLALNMRQPDLSGTPLSVEVAGVVEAVVARDGAPPKCVRLFGSALMVSSIQCFASLVSYVVARGQPGMESVFPMIL